MQYNEAYVFLDANRRNKNKIIEDIIMSIIHSDSRGLPLIINRNPTLVYGGILQVYCIGMCEGYTMALSLQVLKGLAADLSKGPSREVLIHDIRSIHRECELR